jgi:hypothetical protein
MPVESAPYINGLNSSWPIGASDPKSAGAEHLRLIKAAILASFPAIAGAVTSSHTELNLLTGRTGTVWTSANDGASSGLDADMLDGFHAASFAAATHAHSAADITSGTLAVGVGGTGQTSELAYARRVTLNWTIMADPGGTPSGSPGDVFAYY